MVDGHLGPVPRELDTSGDCLAGAHLRGGVGGRGTGGGVQLQGGKETQKSNAGP